MDDERKPLLTNPSNSYFSADGGDNLTVDSQKASTLCEADFTSPFSDGNAGDNPMVTCRCCQTSIDIKGKEDQHVVKCGSCNEATAIRAAPQGKKYVRCPCNCLLICRSESQRIACPRPMCRKIITCENTRNGPALTNVPGVSRVICGHCKENFIFGTSKKALVKCPHCRKISAIGSSYAKSRGGWFCMLTVVVFVIFLIVLLTSLHKASSNPIIYVPLIILSLLGAYFLYKAYYYCSLRISHVEGPI